MRSSRSEMVDYSKWDKFADSESDEDDRASSSLPRVHQFHQPTSVTIGPNGPNYYETEPEDDPTLPLPSPGTSSRAPAAAAEASSSAVSAAAAAVSGGVSGSLKSSEERYETSTHSWQQTRYDVTIWIKKIPLDLKRSDLIIELKNHNILSIHIHAILFFHKQFKYEINTNLNDGIIDWEIISINNEEKLIKFIFQKHQYLPGSAIWWNACFLGDEEIDVMNIPERKLSTNDKIQKQQFSNVWKEANELFQKKIQEKERCSIEIEENEKEGDEMAPEENAVGRES